MNTFLFNLVQTKPMGSFLNSKINSGNYLLLTKKFKIKETKIYSKKKEVTDTSNLFEDITIDINNSDNWYIIKSESYIPNRDEYILKKFKNDFPNVPIGDQVQLIYNLASRNKAINEWLAITNSFYADEATMPLYLKDLVEPSVFKSTQQSITEYNKVVKQEADERLQASIDYKNKLEQIDRKYEKLKEKVKSNKLLRILTLASNELPLTLNLSIETYSPADVTSSPDKKVYARELLTNYKIHLIKILKQNPDVDIETLIKNNLVK